MFKKLKFFLWLLPFVLPVRSQAQIFLQGLITDKSNKPVQNTTIRLKLLTGETTAFSATGDSTGIFKIVGITAGTYTLTATNISQYETSFPLTLSRDTFIHIVSVNKTDTLATVTVTGRKPTFERKTDRFVFNVAGSVLVQGNNVWEVLKQTPMVKATDQGGINVLGNMQNAVIFINRRRFNLSGEDLATYLKDMPSDNIIKIEVLTIPPPYYDASTPVIDILLKKVDINGIKGSVSATYDQASVGKENMTAELSFNKNNYNQSLYISPGAGNIYQRIDKTTLFKNSVPQANINSSIELNSKRRRLNGYTDIRYSISPLVTAGTQWLFNTGKSTINGDGDEELLPSGLRSSFDQDIRRNNQLVSGNAFVKYYSEKRKRTIELSADILNSDISQVSEFINNPNTGSLKTDVPQEIHNFASKLDYSALGGKNAVFEAGLRFSHSAINTPFEAYTYTSGNWVKLDQLSALFKYRETIRAGYATMEKTISDKWAVKLGLRLEITDVETELTGSRKDIIKTTFNFLFPVGYINFNPGSNHSFSLSSRTNNARPDYSNLNPARILVGIRTITEGNPFLKPSGGGALEFGYSYKQQYFFGLNYTISNRLFTQQNEVLLPDTLLIKWQNWGDQKQYTFWFYTGKDVIKSKWSSSLYSSLSYNQRLLEEVYRTSGKYSNNYEFTAMINNSFSNIFSKKLKMYFNFNFSTPSQFGLWRDQNNFRADAGASYSLVKWKAKIALAFNDIFKYADRNVYNTNNTATQYTRVLSNNDSRSVRITFTKSFGNQKTKKLDKRSTSNEEERGRVN